MKFVKPSEFKPQKPYCAFSLVFMFLLGLMSVIFFFLAGAGETADHQGFLFVAWGLIGCGILIWFFIDLYPWFVSTVVGRIVFNFREEGSLVERHSYEIPPFMKLPNGQLRSLDRDGTYRVTLEVPRESDVIAQDPFLQLAVGGWFRKWRFGHRSKVIGSCGWWRVKTWDGVDVSLRNDYNKNGELDHCDNSDNYTEIRESTLLLLQRIQQFSHARAAEDEVEREKSRVESSKSLMKACRKESDQLRQALDHLGVSMVFATDIIRQEKKLGMNSPHAVRDRRFLETRYGHVLNPGAMDALRDRAREEQEVLLDLWVRSGDSKFQGLMRRKHDIEHDIRPVEEVHEQVARPE